MDPSRDLTHVLFCAFLIFVSSAAAQVVLAGGFAAVPSRSTEVCGYNPAHGTEEDEIRKHFDLHRGRWWNYYERGSWYLAYGHYPAAERDFRRVIRKRPTDGWDARTYGMHFLDCFAHRELGIALYYQATRGGTDVRRLLQEAAQELRRSLSQVRSSRAEFFLDLAEGEQWKASDTTPPVIAVENAASRGRNWAILFCNRRIVPLDIRVTDAQSGVGAVWVNEKRLVFDRARPIPTVYVPIDANDPWIQIRARDLVNNYSPPTRVRVELDLSPPVIFTAADPVHMTSDGLVPIECSAHDDLGLRAIEIGGRKIDCHGRQEYNAALKVPATPGGTRVEIRATDLAGSTTQGFVAFLPAVAQTRMPVGPASRLAGLIHPNEPPWALLGGPRAVPAFLGNRTFRLASRTPAQDRQEPYFGNQVPREAHKAALATIPVRRVPAFEFSNYRPVSGGHLVTTAQYTVKGTLRSAAGVTRVAVGETTVGVESHAGMMHFSAIVDLPNLGENKLEARALYSDGSAVAHPEPLVFRRVCEPTMESKCLYSVIVLPLVPEGIPVDHRPGSLFPSLGDTVVACTQCDPNLGEFLRFDCSKVVEHLDPNTLSNDLRDLNVRETSDPQWAQVVHLGREHGADLGIYGCIREDEGHYEIKLRIVDIATGTRLKGLKIPNNVIDAYGPKENPDWLVTQLREKLARAIPRVRGNVMKIFPRSGKIYVDANKERLFIWEKLWIFEKGTVPSARQPCAGLFEATVDLPMEGRSQARVNRAKTDGDLLREEPDKFFFVTK